MEKHLVSIVMPMRNAANWLAQTIESIQLQTLDCWELIIIDDHSVDASRCIVEQLSQSDSRIRYFFNEGRGIVAALNQGLRLANGEFLTRMDADDCMSANRLHLMVTCLQHQSEKTIVTGKVRYFSDSAVSKGYLKYEHWLNERVEQNDFYQHIYRECVVASPNWMGRTKEFVANRLFEQLNYPEDYELCFRWMKHAFSIQPIQEVTLLWREHPMRTSRNSDLYSQESFFQLKLKWFRFFYPSIRSVGIVGMGSKGKLCASFFDQQHVPFSVYDLHFEDFSVPILGRPVCSPDAISDEIILIARYPDNLRPIQEFIEKKGYEIGKNAFWV